MSGYPTILTTKAKKADDQQRFDNLVKDREQAAPLPDLPDDPMRASGATPDAAAFASLDPAASQPPADPMSALGGAPSPAPEAPASDGLTPPAPPPMTVGPDPASGVPGADDDWIGTMLGGRVSASPQPSMPANADAPLGSPPGQANDSTSDDWIGTMLGGKKSPASPEPGFATPQLSADRAAPDGSAGDSAPSMAPTGDLGKFDALVADRYPDLGKTANPGTTSAPDSAQPTDDLAKLDALASERYGISPSAERKQITGEAPPAEEEEKEPLVPDMPGLRLPGGATVLPGKAVQDPEEIRRKIRRGEPLTAQDAVNGVVHQAQNQFQSTPAALEGAIPGRSTLGSVGEELIEGLPKTNIYQDVKRFGEGVVDLGINAVKGALGGGSKAAEKIAPAATEAAPASRRFFHGTGSAFDKPGDAKFDSAGLYGPGYYLTDDPRVAGSYAEQRASDLDVGRVDEWDRVWRELGHAESRAKTAGPDQAEWTARAADLRKQFQEIRDRVSPGANIRGVDVPEGLTLLDADAPATVQDVKRVAGALAPDEQAYFLNGIKPRVQSGDLTGHDIYEWTSNATLDPKKTNEVLTQAGYDGVRYSGGKRIPMNDDTGNTIEHTAVAIFPESLPKIKNAISGTAGGIVDRSLDRLTDLKAPAAENLAGAAAGAVAGDIAGDENDTPEQRAERIAAGALLGGTTVAAGKRLARGKSALPEAASERLGVGPASAYEPDPSDFPAYMQHKKDLAAGQPSRPTSRQPIGKKAEKAYYRKADDLGIGALDETGEARARGTDLNMLDEGRDLSDDDLARFAPEDYAAVARAAIEPRAPRTAADLVSSGRSMEGALRQRDGDATRVKREMAGGLETPAAPTPLIDKVQAYRYANMLSDWSARTADVISGGLESVARPTGMFLSGAVLPNKTGRARMGAAVADVGAMLHAVPDGVRAGLDTLVAGQAKFGNTRAAGEAEGALGTVGRVLTPARDLMQAADDGVKTVNFAGAYASEARVLADKNKVDLAELMQNPTPELLERTMQRVNSVTYTDDLTGLPKVLQKIPREAGWEGVAFSLVMPFVRVSANITKGGTVLLGRGMGGGLLEAGVRGLRGDSEGARHALGQTALGASVLAGSAYLASQGRLTGSGPSDPTKRAQLQATGWQPNSYFDGERYHDVKNLLGRFAFPVLAVANAWETVLERAGEKGKKIASLEDVAAVMDAETVSRLVGHTAAALTDMNYLRPLRDMFVNAERGGLSRVAEGLATNVIASFVPLSGAMAHVERVTDPVERSTDTVADRVKGRVPVLSGTVPVEPDIYGRTKTRPADDTAAQLVLPWRSTPKRTDPVASEVARLVGAGQDVGVKKVGKEYAGVQQQPETRRAIQVELGEAARVFILQEIASPEYQAKSDKGKAATLTKQVRLAYEMADAGLGEQVERTPAGKALLAYNSIPHYRGITETDPVKIRRQNKIIAEAKALLGSYRAKHENPDQGLYEFRQANPAEARLAERPEIPSDYLKRKRAAIYDALGVEPPEEDQSVLGAGNIVRGSP